MSALTYAELVCLDDFDPYGAETTSDLQNYEQDIYHRISQAPGSNPDDPNAGAGLEAILSSSPTPQQVQNLIITEVRKDPRTVTATCTAVQNDDGTMSAALTCETDDETLATAVSVGPNGTTLIGGAS